MDLFIYLGALFIFLIPLVIKQIHFLDTLILLYFYFDATIVFVSHEPSFNYFENMLIGLYSVFHFISTRSRSFKYIYPSVIYLALTLSVPIILGTGINQTLRLFSTYYASIIIMPIAFQHYSSIGKIKNLIKSGFWFILIWCIYVAFATSVHLGGYQSERIGGSFFYFGHVAVRGGITYISFALLLIPLMLKYLNQLEKIIILICSLFILIVFVAVLKRFVFFVIALGLLNYLIKSDLSLRFKFRTAAIAAITGIVLFTNQNIRELFEKRLQEEGGEELISINFLSRDIRIYEPLYVLREVLIRPPVQILFGSKEMAIMDIKDDEFNLEERKIHNEYATILFTFGILGLIFYLGIFISIYRITYRIKRYLTQRKVFIIDFWIVFQNLLVIFLIEGMVGGHVHVTFRGMVFLYIGAIAGYFMFQYRNFCAHLPEIDVNHKII